MKKKITNLFLLFPFILSIFFFILRSTISDVVEVDGSIIEQGFGYSVMGGILFIFGMLLVCIRVGASIYRNYKLIKFNN